MMRGRHAVIGAGLMGLGWAVACTLNPQPLPPAFDSKGVPGLADAATFGSNDDASPAPTSSDAKGETSDDAGLEEAGVDAGNDAGDADAGVDSGDS